MSIASGQPAEITLLDMLRFIWRAKWYALGGVVAGLLLGCAATLLLPDTINRTVTLTIYPSGTPTDTADDIKNQLTALLARQSFAAVPARVGSDLTIAMPYHANELGNADGKVVMLAQAVSKYRSQLLAKVNGAYFDLQGRYGAEGRAETLVKFRSWQDGIKDGSIDPVRISATEADNRAWQKTAVLIVGAFLGGLMGFVVVIFRNLLAQDRLISRNDNLGSATS